MDSTCGGRASGSQVFWLAVAALAPATVLAAGPALVVFSAGTGTWLSYVGATLIALAVAVCVAVFARRRAVSGSIYSYVSEALGNRPGFITGWALLVGYVGVTCAVVAGVGLYSSSFLAELGADGGSDLVQVATYAVVSGLGTWLALRGVQESALVTLGVQVASVLLITVVLVASVVERGIDLGAQLSLEGASLGDVGLGMTITFISLVGFESSAALGAEARNPRRTIPRLLFLVPALLGGVYVLVALLQVPVLQALAEPLAAGASPSTLLADDAGLGGMTAVLDLALGASFAAAAVGLVNFSSRVIATMSTDSVLPARLGRLHARHGTPRTTILWVGAAAFVLPSLIALVSTQSALGIFTLLGTPGSFGFLFAYVLVAVAAVKVRTSATVAVAALAAGGGAIWVYVNAIANPAPAPFDVLPFVFAGLMVVGAVAMLLLPRRAGEPPAPVEPVREDERPPVGAAR